MEKQLIKPRISSAKHEELLLSPVIIAIREKEIEIREKEFEVSRLKGELEFMKKSYENSVVVKWREEIRECFSFEDDGIFLKSTKFVSDCVAYNNIIKADRNVRNNIASTLSLMHKEGELGRLVDGERSYYGLAKYFNKDLVTVKKEYANKINLV